MHVIDHTVLFHYNSYEIWVHYKNCICVPTIFNMMPFNTQISSITQKHVLHFRPNVDLNTSHLVCDRFSLTLTTARVEFKEYKCCRKYLTFIFMVKHIFNHIHLRS